MPVERKQLSQPLSEKRLKANRRNALKSSGPTSRSGRAISSQNARKYDLLPFENPDLPALLTARYYGRYMPSNKNERRIVDDLALSERVLLTCSEIERRIHARHPDKGQRAKSRSGVAALQLLIEIGHERNRAERVQSDALRRLEAIRTKAA